MYRNCFYILFILCLFMQQSLHAQKSDDTLFFKSIEQKLRLDYQTCTGDNSPVSLNKLIHWKNSINSVVARNDYPRILQSFFEDSSNSKSRGLPCDVAAWYQNKMYDKHIKDSLADIAAKAAIMKTSDSLALAKDLSTAKRTPVDIMNIPFGVSHRSVLTLLTSRGITDIVDQKSILYYTDSSSQTFFIRAFFFNDSGTYYKYETETRTVRPDSLDMVLRPLLLNMETLYRELTSSESSKTFYIGFNDIIHGKLSISKTWTIKGIKIYTGLSMHNNLFYAKSIVISNIKQLHH